MRFCDAEKTDGYLKMPPLIAIGVFYSAWLDKKLCRGGGLLRTTPQRLH
jgi:hypothetical protein